MTDTDTAPIPAPMLPDLVVEVDSGFAPDSRLRGDDTINPATPYAGQAFAWHTMSPAERRAFVLRSKDGKPGRRRYVRRNYC